MIVIGMVMIGMVMARMVVARMFPDCTTLDSMRAIAAAKPRPSSSAAESPSRSWR